MARKTNPKLIGGFVLGAIALVIVGALAFGGGQFLKPKAPAVLFFQGSLSGLDIGSPVTFRGVKVGTVTDMIIKYDVTKQVLRIPVRIQLDLDKFQIVSGERNPEKNINELVARGLRAQLQSVSLVTGQTGINFDFHPDTPVRLVGAEPGAKELPTIPSDIDLLKANVSGLLAKISKLPLEQISSQMLDVVQSADKMMKDVQGVVSDVGGQVKPLSASLLATSNQAGLTLKEVQSRAELREGEPMQNLNQTLADARKLVASLDRNLPQLMAAAGQTLKTTTTALNQAELTLRAAQRSISPDSPLYFELNGTLREIRSAAMQLGVLAEYLQRNPNALLTGKQ
jgi:paraquat-inducible protein B